MSDILHPKNSLIVYKGESKTLSLSIKKSDNSSPNITGGKIVFTVKRYLTDQNWLIRKTSDVSGEVLITSASGGKAEIYLTPADTKNLEEAEYVFDVWLVMTGKQYLVVRPSIFDLQQSVAVL